MIFCVWTAMLFTACSSIHYLNIETYNPAEITFPGPAEKVLIVNNAVAQPPTSGYEYMLMGVKQDTCWAYADSALYYACNSLGKTIVEADYFEDVLLYHHPVRTDDVFLADEKLTSVQVRELCDETGTDVIISLDRLLFNMKKNVQALPGGFFHGTIRIDIRGLVRAYTPNRETPLATVVIADSVYWEDFADSQIMMDAILPLPDAALRVAGRYIGANLYENFVPNWQEEIRWFYKGNTSAWKEASAYAIAGKWSLAAERWETIYNRSSGKQKARAASNLAIAAELESKFEAAHEWGVQAHDLFRKVSGEEAKETKLQEAYLTVLQERIVKDRKLTIQFGED